MNNNLIKIEEVTSIMGLFPEVVNKSNNSVAKCNEAGQAILDTIEGNGSMNESLDHAAAEYLKKVGKTVANMGERRKPITQIFDRIRSHFTSQEKEIDPKDPNTIPGKIARKRDEYAKWKYQEEQKRKQEAERVAKVNNEKATYRRDLEYKILSFFTQYLNTQKQEVNRMFNELTLPVFERVANMIRLFSTDYPRSHFDKFTDDVATYYVNTDTKKNLRIEVLHGKYDAYKLQFRQEIEDAKQYCIDRFASKKKELEEIEELRKKDAEAAALAEQEKVRREQEEAARREQERKQREEQQRQQISANAQQEQMTSLFDQSAATVAPAPTNAKVKEKIQVLHPAGFLEVLNMWWINEGQQLPLDELAKVFKKQITFCEKQANAKEPKRIESRYINYVEDVKAK